MKVHIGFPGLNSATFWSFARQGCCLLALSALSLAAAANHSFEIVSDQEVVVTASDLVEYVFSDHAMKVRGPSMARLAGMKAPVTGKPFQVVVDGQAVYSGRFVPVVSSMTFKEPTILLDVKTNRPYAIVVISGPMHHEPQFQNGQDPRMDVRITKTLQDLGKLRAGVPGGAWNDWAFNARLVELLKEAQSITTGMTRKQLLEVFEQEGGIFTAQKARFVHRACSAIKVDVEFAVAEGTNNKPLSEDKIRSMSKFYLGWDIID